MRPEKHLFAIVFVIAALVAPLCFAGCAWQDKLLDSKQQIAFQTAMNRARFEMNCPDATGTLLSRTVIQPYLYGVARAEYTIGIQGCEKRQTFVVVCPDGGVGCFAGERGVMAEVEPDYTRVR
jgi:hypothetical protein